MMVVIVVILVETLVAVVLTVFVCTKAPEGTVWFKAYPEMKKSKTRTIRTLALANFLVLLESNNRYCISFNSS